MSDTPKPPPIPRRKTGDGEAPKATGTTGTTDTPRRAAGGTKPSSATRAPARGKLQKSLEELFSAPALAYSLAGDAWAAEFVAERAPVLAEAWADLADQNPAVKRILTRLTEGSAWGGVIIATGGTALPLLAHHGLLPAPLSDVVGPRDSGNPGRPIVPPPPAPSGAPPPPMKDPGNPPPGAGRNSMTPPLRADQPPGVVTVAGTNAVT